jgi:phosphinothricin acetyltransferase
MTNKPFIRRAQTADLQQLLDIYNYEVLHGVATFDITPKSLDERRQWLEEHNIGNFPLILAVDTADAVMGYASLSAYRTKEAYRQTAELSVYIAPDHRGKGVASALLEAIIDIARRETDLHTIVSVITSGNDISRRLHEKFGFEFCGTMRDVGMKWGEWLGIDNFTLHI